MYYFRDHDRIATLYVEFWRRNGRTARLFPFIEHDRDHYLARYVLPCEFHRRLHPFQFLYPGAYVVHVGFHDQYIHAGVSHPLIMAAIVGDTGHIWAIDPDPRNTETLEQYKNANEINNLSILQSGVWKNKSVQDFVFFNDYTSSNTISSIFETYRDGVNKRWGQTRIDTKSTVQRIPVDTLDSIVTREVPNGKVDFLNLTVNGAEEQALSGATEILRNNPDLMIGFPLANASTCALDRLRDMGFIVAVADQPHRPWEEMQFLYGCAMRKNPEYLLSRGFRPVKLKTEATLAEDGTGRFILEEA